MKKVIFFILVIIPFNVYGIDLPSSFISVDMNSGRIFYEKNSDDVRLIASTTKIMTAIVGIENSNLTDIVSVGSEILDMYGSNIYLEYNESILFLDLLYGLMMRSGNDASVSIAKHSLGSVEKFVVKMNEKAKELGMNDTVFSNPHGLDDITKNFSTAYDLSLLYKYAYKNSIFNKIISTKEYKTSSNYKGYYFVNRCKSFLEYINSTGCKTGYTPDAGRILVSSASKNGIDAVNVSFDTDYNYSLHQSIYEEIFNSYSNYLILNKNMNIESMYKDKVYISEDVYYPLKSEEVEKIRYKTEFFDIKKYKNNDVVGKLYVYLDNDIIYKTNIYIKKASISFFKKIIEFFFN